MKRLAILGSTGSIGTSTLDVVARFPERFAITALAAGTNVERLAEQVRTFRPACVAVRDAGAAARLAALLGPACRVFHGRAGLIEVATWPDVDLVVSALVGAIGLAPTWAAIDGGRDVALANKETLVVAGEPITRRARETGATLLPVDSEHNALHQCLRGESIAEVRRLWLTASGGPFLRLPAVDLACVTVDQALAHPTWRMGRKVTIDSATLMNKGLEVIEARWLFGIEPARIRVVVHPTSVVHSLVEFVDGSFKAQLGVTDMRHPIQYALSWPTRWPTTLPPFDPVAAGPLVFEPPDRERFPCLDLAYRALEAGGAAPAALNAANEVAVAAFLEGRIRFSGIAPLVAETLERHAADPAVTLDDLERADARARDSAARALERTVER